MQRANHGPFLKIKNISQVMINITYRLYMHRLIVCNFEVINRNAVLNISR